MLFGQCDRKRVPVGYALDSRWHPSAMVQISASHERANGNDEGRRRLPNNSSRIGLIRSVPPTSCKKTFAGDDFPSIFAASRIGRVRKSLREPGGFFVASTSLVLGGALFGEKCLRLINSFGKDDARCR